MGFWQTILDVVILLAVALLLGVLCERLRQSALVGYLLAGLLLGPGVLNLVRNEQVIHQIAELGVAMLLFVIGLEFSWRRLRSFGAIGIGGGGLQILVTIVVVAAIFLALGWTGHGALVVGIIVAPSSTACVLRTLTDRAAIDSQHGRSSLGILLTQDLALVPLLILVALLGPDAGDGGVGEGLFTKMLVAAAVAGLFILVVNYLLPRLFTAAAVARNRELPILLAVTTALAATWAVHAIGLSPALGAFVAGMLLAESPYATWIRADVGVLRTLFVTLFFASIGMVDDLGWVAERWDSLIVAVPGVLVVKAVIVVAATRLLSLPWPHAIATGICLAQTGEFSFVLAAAATGGSLSGESFQMVVAVTVITLLLTPYLIAIAPTAGRVLAAALGRPGPGGTTAVSAPRKDHVVVIGYGPAGAGVVSALHAVGVSTVVIDLNPHSAERARLSGALVYTGDATHKTILEEVHLDDARAVVVTIPDHQAALQIVEMVAELAPRTLAVARSRHSVHADLLRSAGAVVIDEEAETGRAIGVKLLLGLGLVPPP